MAHEFKRSKNEVVFSKDALAEFRAKHPGSLTDFTVTSEIRLAANAELLRQARELAFESRNAFVDSIHEVILREPDLFRISRAPLASDRTATVVAI